MSRDLLDRCLALGLGEVAVLNSAQNQAVLNQRYQITLTPSAPFEHAVLYNIQVPIPIPDDMGQPISRLGSLTTTATTYSTVATWTVASGRNGALFEVALDTNNFALTNWQLTIAGVQQWTAQTIRSTLAIPYSAKNQLAQGAVVTLAAASTDGTSITAYGHISGKEFPTHVFTLDVSKPGCITTETLLVTRDIIERGVDAWAYMSSRDPLVLDVTNVNGFGNERFVVVARILNTDLERFRKMLELGLVAPHPGAPAPFDQSR